MSRRAKKVSLKTRVVRGVAELIALEVARRVIRRIIHGRA
jgi:hypothetical protein